MKTTTLVIGLFVVIQQCTAQQSLDASGCDAQKSCWFMPPACKETPAECESIVKWSGSDVITMEMQGNVSGIYSFMAPGNGWYISFGFSYDEIMGIDSVVECVHSPKYSNVKAYVSWNEGTHNERLTGASNELLKLQSSSFSNDVLTCVVEWNTNNMDKVPFIEKPKVMDLGAEPYYLMFAMGQANAITYEMGIHPTNDFKFPWTSTKRHMVKSGPGIVAETVTDMKQSTVSREIRYQLAAFHGILMIYGWWFFGAVALLFARYFKGMFPERKILGEPIWYQLHRDLFIISLALQVGGFVIIFVAAGRIFICTDDVIECKGTNYDRVLHTWLGVACTFLALIEPFYAWIRPDGDSRWRVSFNWIHWILGQLSFLMAAIAMFLGIPLGKTGLRRIYGYKCDWIMGSYILAYLIASFLLEFVSSREKRKNAVGAPSDMKMSVLNGPNKPGGSKSPAWSSLRIGILVLFSLYALAVCTVISWLLFWNGFGH